MNRVIFIFQIRPIGKITVCEKPQELEEQEESSCPSSVPTTATSNDDEDIKPPLITKTIKREIDDRKFTIETTVRMEKVNKKNKNCKEEEQCPKKRKQNC